MRKDLKRRGVLAMTLGALGIVAALMHTRIKSLFHLNDKDTDMSDVVISRFPIDFHWPTQDPFLFCAYHLDRYPMANQDFGPASGLSGRRIGMDFTVKDGFRMYHGDVVPGFPLHPHRGFETITLVRQGFVDHADSLGAGGRYGRGDVQWMTAGAGIQHSEMFPLLYKDKENTLEILQIWINLPKKNKLVDANYTMYWEEQIPKVDLDGGKVQLELIAGVFDGKSAPPAPKDSWASDDSHEVALWLVEMKEGGSFSLPESKGDVNRTLYVYEGSAISIEGEAVSKGEGVRISSQSKAQVSCDSDAVKFLVLQGKAINEPVAQHGPFVMNTRTELEESFREYQKTQFGGWPWPRKDVVHGDSPSRFAKHADGKEEKPG